MKKRAAARPYRMGARAATAAATAERIVAAATELFLARPYEEVTLDEVAQRAAVTVQTVLRGFGSKEGLAEAAAEVGQEKVRAARDEAPIGDTVGAIRNLIEHYEEWGERVLLMLSQEDRVAPVR